ncbi:hypothetical protein HUU62_00860 [Rhodoferax sp. 4810]|uniref:Type II secretion system protein GspC N-terminal domain-containing protein n=1 Tax=Thiospirillum jenense TaxID=1653858 RepID=A0A839H616_9GAMM|nr:hypothetical protein [Thiospirillum jenense]MBB1072966.1 hypothetical protein [Rhodoferax jenense]MBB1124914.1 hypothetical protein [Thiospirillum jenense]
MKWLLTLVILALSAILYQQWWHWTPPTAPPPPPAAASTAPPAPALTAPPPPSQESYSVVIERPLFLPDRRPPPPSSKTTAGEPEATVVPVDVAVLDSFDLSAILIIGATHSAWIRKTRGPEVVRVRHGELLEGWMVKEITADSVLLEQQGQTKRLVLRDYDKPPPLIPPTPRTVGGNRPSGKPATDSAVVGQAPPAAKAPMPGSISGTGGANTTAPAAPPRPAPPKVPSFGPG